MKRFCEQKKNKIDNIEYKNMTHIYRNFQFLFL